MAKAKTVVGLDVHATKIAAAVLDVETGELSRFQMIGDAAGAAGFLCRVAASGAESRMRPARPGTGSRAELAPP